jgi:hypothetical protein
MTFNKEGLCEICQKYDKKWKPWLENREIRERTETNLKKKLDRAKEKGGVYDCVVGLSGGKDSLYTLYVAVKRFGLNPVAVAIDNGFLTNEAKEVIRKACETLKVDYIIYRQEMIYDLYRHFFLKTGTFCTVCFIVIIRALQKFTRYFHAPYLLIGKSTRLDPVSPRGANPFFFQKVCKESPKDLRRQINFTKGGYLDIFLHYKMGKMIKIPDHIMWDYDAIKYILKEDLDIDMFTEHEDCWAYPMKQYLMVQKYGFGQKFLKATSLARNGIISREEAVQVHHCELSCKDELPTVTERFIETLNVKIKDVYHAPQIKTEKYYGGFGNWLLSQRHKLLRGRA